MSELRRLLDEYLSVRRALGFKLRDVGVRLEKFVSYLEDLGKSVITTQLAVSWSQRNPAAAQTQWAANLSTVRHFAQYCSGCDQRTEIPLANVLPYRYQRKAPHIYSAEEIDKLLEAASRLRPPRGVPPQMGLRPYTYSTLFGLLASTGLRISEAVGLSRESVDLANGVLTVRRSKFGKSRLLPLHCTTLAALQLYARRRDKLHPLPRSPWFFVGQQGGRLDGWTLRATFISLSRQIGLRGDSDRHGPRLHDFRHSFAVRTLLNWYQTGQDVEQKLPFLSAYLGHAHPSDTYWYLSATPELLAQATLRLEKTLGGEQHACQ